jgi:glutamine amidotransferase
MIAIVDYGLGNVRSVMSALEFLGVCATITRNPDDLFAAEKLILPGVGSFRAAMENIHRRDLQAPIVACVREHKTPILGICLGMQLLAESGDEDGTTPGLGLIAGEVTHFPDVAPPMRIPHIGFNTATFVQGEGSIFQGLGPHADFYFVHSYRMICSEPSDVSSSCEYGERFTASVQRGHIYGTQFHPEKSQSNGLRVLKNFVGLTSTTRPPC